MNKRLVLGTILLLVLAVGLLFSAGFVLAADITPPGAVDIYVKASIIHTPIAGSTDDWPKDMIMLMPPLVYEAEEWGGTSSSASDCVAVYPMGWPEGYSYCAQGYCKAPGDYWQIGTEGGVNDQVLICAPEGLVNPAGLTLNGAWLDLDQFNETGDTYCDRDELPKLKVARAGISTEYENGVDYDFGEYTDSTNKECCGDDGNEVVVTEHCDGGGGITPLCCPADKQYKIFGDACIAADSCPDIERVPPVWLGISDNRFWAEMNVALAEDGDPKTYCCDSLTGPEPDKPMCVYPAINGQLGCILDTNQEFATASMTWPYVQWCPTDDSCVYDSGLALSSLEISMSCNESAYEVNVFEPQLCYDTQRNVERIACYDVMPEGCSIDDVEIGDGCTEVTEIHCPGSNCEALCLINDDRTSCIETCQEYNCETIKTYRGSGCGFLNGCDPSIKKCVEIGEPEFTIPLQNCEPYPGGWLMKDTVCWEGQYLGGFNPVSQCKSVDPATGDRSQIVDNGGDILYCDSVGLITDGDPWCPLGYRYIDGFCQLLTDVCDQGFSGNLMYGCDNLYTPDDDPLFEEYQEECVGRSPNAPPISVYDQTCCYDAAFNGYELYQWGIEEDYIKIY